MTSSPGGVTTWKSEARGRRRRSQREIDGWDPSAFGLSEGRDGAAPQQRLIWRNHGNSSRSHSSQVCEIFCFLIDAARPLLLPVAGPDRSMSLCNAVSGLLGRSIDGSMCPTACSAASWSTPTLQRSDHHSIVCLYVRVCAKCEGPAGALTGQSRSACLIPIQSPARSRVATAPAPELIND